MSRKRWSEEELLILKKNFASKTPEELEAILPGRSYKSMWCQATKIDLKRGQPPHPNAWTEEEDLILEKHYSKASWEELLKLLPGRTRQAIETRCGKLELSRKGNWLDRKRGQKKWTLEECAKWHGYQETKMSEDYFNHLLHIQNTLNGRAA